MPIYRRNGKSEWLLFNAKWTIFQQFDGEKMLHYDDMLVMSTLYYPNS